MKGAPSCCRGHRLQLIRLLPFSSGQAGPEACPLVTSGWPGAVVPTPSLSLQAVPAEVSAAELWIC